MSDPDPLDIQAQLALVDTLQDIRLPSVPQAVMAASNQVGGRGIIPRFLKATRGPGKISIHEFIYYRMFETGIPEAELPRYVGAKVRLKQMLTANDEGWGAPAYDKVLWDMLMTGAGLPRPDLRAVYGMDFAGDGVARLTDRAALEAWLSDPAHYPMLAKPNNAGRSLGILGMDGVTDGQIRLHDGSDRPVGAVADFIQGFLGGRYLFQERLSPHPDIAALTGGALATLRVIVLYRDGQALIDNVVLKWPAPGAIADNFWRQGNLLSAIDAETGAIGRTVTGSGLSLQRLESYPGTDTAFKGMTVPDWSAVQDFCAAAAPYFNGISIQGWDIALTDRGPVPVEVNFKGDVNLQQLVHGKGAMTPAYCAHLRAFGYTGKLPD